MRAHFNIKVLVLLTTCLILAFSVVIIVGGCSSDSTDIPEGAVTYELVFKSTWSEQTHPLDFPENPHFSGLIGATHSSTVRLWDEGQLATEGIKNMAEKGRKSPLDNEIDQLIDNGSACFQISGDGINPSPGIVTVTFTAIPECPQVSVVSMIAPSPDWFVGVSGLTLHENGEWVKEKTVELYPYDAGTDSGVSYASEDQATESPDAIRRIEGYPLVNEGTVTPLGTFTFHLLETPVNETER